MHKVEFDLKRFNMIVRICWTLYNLNFFDLGMYKVCVNVFIA